MWLVSKWGEAQGRQRKKRQPVSEFSLTRWDSASWVCSPLSLEPCLILLRPRSGSPFPHLVLGYSGPTQASLLPSRQHLWDPDLTSSPFPVVNGSFLCSGAQARTWGSTLGTTSNIQSIES